MRALGWRYSATRNAWVHRALNGRLGPVFQEAEERGALDPAFAPDQELVACLTAMDARTASAPTPSGLPRRIGPSSRPVPARSLAVDADGPRVLRVDGRPPRIGTATPAVPVSDPEFLRHELQFATG